jgi:hypothetical protein
MAISTRFCEANLASVKPNESDDDGVGYHSSYQPLKIEGGGILWQGL